MRLKKGFTLAEILIVLMVIGAIATMTIPSLMRGVTDTQFKTAYKKAFNTVVNLSSMERVAGNLPADNTGADVMSFFETLVSYLSVKDYAEGTAPGSLTTSSTPTKFYNGVKYTITPAGGGTAVDHTIGDQTAPLSAGEAGEFSPWLVSEDNIAYMVVKAGATNAADGDNPGTAKCSPKATINASTTAVNAFNNSCLAVVVDVNGPTKGPNVMSTLGSEGIKSEADALPEISGGDRYYIYLGSDGATAGPRLFTATGRIVSDQK